MSIHKFYVYVLARPDGSVFYVGKGTGRRIDAHEQAARSGHDCRKCRIIRMVWKQGGQITKQIVFTTDDEQAAFDREIALIAEYGRENLANLAIGGPGIRGVRLTFSPEHRERLRIARTGKTFSAETKAKIGAKSRGRIPSAETRAKKSATMKRLGIKPPSTKGKRLSPEHVAKVSAAQKGKPKPSPSAETRAKLSAALTRRMASPEVRAKLSARFKGRPATVAAVAACRKLTMEQAREIRVLYATGQYNQPQLARVYGVDESCINRIIKGKTYREE